MGFVGLVGTDSEGPANRHQEVGDGKDENTDQREVGQAAKGSTQESTKEPCEQYEDE